MRTFGGRDGMPANTDFGECTNVYTMSSLVYKLPAGYVCPIAPGSSSFMGVSS
jgi:hypothetical protein